MMRFKGRIQVGADADITIFNPNTSVDKAHLKKGWIIPRVALNTVMVNGTLC